MDPVGINDFDSLPDWLGKEPGFALVHPDDWDEIEPEAGGLLHALGVDVRQSSHLGRGQIYFMKSTLNAQSQWNPLMKKSWD